MGTSSVPDCAFENSQIMDHTAAAKRPGNVLIDVTFPAPTKVARIWYPVSLAHCLSWHSLAAPLLVLLAIGHTHKPSHIPTSLHNVSHTIIPNSMFLPNSMPMLLSPPPPCEKEGPHGNMVGGGVGEQIKNTEENL